MRAVALANQRRIEAPSTVHLLNVSAFAAPGRHIAGEYVDVARVAARFAHATERVPLEVTHGTRSAPLVGEGVVQFSEELRPDMVVMGTLGRGRAERALLGSVAQDVARSLPLPLLLVPPARRRRQERAGAEAIG